MQTVIDKRGLLQGAILLSIGLSAFGFAWLTWSGSSHLDCRAPGTSERAIRECVALQAQATEPEATPLLVLIAGVVVISAASVMLGRAIRIRRVITLVDAAQQLGISPGAVRQLVDDGTLQMYEQRLGVTYLYPEQVHRYVVGSSGTSAAGRRRNRAPSSSVERA